LIAETKERKSTEFHLRRKKGRKRGKKRFLDYENFFRAFFPLAAGSSKWDFHQSQKEQQIQKKSGFNLQVLLNGTSSARPPCGSCLSERGKRVGKVRRTKNGGKKINLRTFFLLLFSSQHPIETPSTNLQRTLTTCFEEVNSNSMHAATAVSPSSPGGASKTMVDKTEFSWFLDFLIFIFFLLLFRFLFSPSFLVIFR